MTAADFRHNAWLGHAGLVQQLQQALSPRRVKALQQTSTESHLMTQHSLDTPVKFATVHAAVSSHTPQLSQAGSSACLHWSQRLQSAKSYAPVSCFELDRGSLYCHHPVFYLLCLKQSCNDKHHDCVMTAKPAFASSNCLLAKRC